MLDLSRARDVALTAAKAAGERILAGYGEELTVTTKSDIADKVTQIDIEAETCLISHIAQSFPHHSILSEEGADSMGDTQYRWVIDPLDGTSNYTRRLPHVGVSIALQHDGESIVGVLYFPVYDHAYVAVKGGGAFRNGEAIHVSPCKRMADAYIAEVFSDRVCRGRTVTYPPCAAYRKFGSAITASAYVADGALHATALRCYLWDIAAADILIREAGGRTEWSFNDPEDVRGPLTFFAATPGIFDEFTAFAQAQYGSE